jgi:hypothetical protein
VALAWRWAATRAPAGVPPRRPPATAIGLVQALFILAVALPLLPYLHPRMATEDFGPNPTHQLEPPGFLALNYGRFTPAATVVAHLLYGAILGPFYTLTPR